MKSQRWLRGGVGTVALLAIAFFATALVVHEGQAVLVTRFGRPLRADTGAGLHWKLPWPIDQAIWPATLIAWARRAGLHLVGCGGFVNVRQQRWYLLKQLKRLTSLRRW